MRKLMNKKTKKNRTNVVINFLKSPHAIFLVLILFIIGLLIYTRFLTKATLLYSFSGYEEDFSILNGTIYVGHEVNYFGDSKIVYTGESLNLKDFEIGYYIKYDDSYEAISVTKKNEDVGDSIDLKEFLLNTDFSFTETHKDAKFISNKTIDNIDKLVFAVRGKDANDEEVNIIVPLEISKLTK